MACTGALRPHMPRGRDADEWDMVTEQQELLPTAGITRRPSDVSVPRAGTWALDSLTGQLTWSDATALLHGVSLDTFGGQLADFGALVHADDRPNVHRAIGEALESDEPLSVEYRVTLGDGTLRWLLATGARAGNAGRLEGVTVDMTARRRTEAMAYRSAAWFRGLVQQAHDPILVVDSDLTLRFASPAVERLLGCSPGELIGRSLMSVVDPADAQAAAEIVAKAIDASTVSISTVVRCSHRDGHPRDVQFIAAPLRDIPGIRGVILSAHDVTAQRAVEARLAHQAYHDALTGLPNRTRFTTWLAGTLESSRRERSVTLLFIDLDRFKVVNDSLGHEAGDALLTEVGRRLQECLGSGAALARFGGDEFAAFFTGIDETEAVAIAERVINCLQRPIPLAGRDVCTGASVGIAMGVVKRDTSGKLLREADVALYQAKQSGRGMAFVYRPEMTVEPPVWFELEADLRRAVERGELRLHYQPLMEASGRRVVAIEALLRWKHPTRGLVPPMDFISLAEETGLIVPIGEWLIDEACRQMVAWCADDATGVLEAIHVNVSARQLQHPRFAERLERALRQSGLPAERMRLEVTERVLVDDVRSGAQTLGALRELGIRLAIDDFGAGASSLGHLRELQADVLKLDRSLVQRLDIDLGDRAVVRAVTALAHAFDMRVVAEGIETPSQLASIMAVGCDWGQGFLFGAPRSASEMAVFLDASNASLIGDLTAGRSGPGGPTRELAAILGLAHTGMLNPSRTGGEQ
jgi:diguanylate cyclase (GGDEF)-like protein/PAS domain S-box-containing protein